MRHQALVLAAAIGAGSCAQAAHHPAITVGLATGAIAFGTCQVDAEKVGDCAAIGAIAGVALGLITAIVYHFTDSDAHELKLDDSLGSDGVVHLHTFTPPPPVPLDAGIGSAETPPTVPLDAGIGSAGPPGETPTTVPATPPIPADAGIDALPTDAAP